MHNRSLEEHRPVTVLREAGITACPRCAAIHSSEDGFCPNCGLSMGRRVDLPADLRSVAAAGAPTDAPTAAGAPTAAPTAAQVSTAQSARSPRWRRRNSKSSQIARNRPAAA